MTEHRRGLWLGTVAYLMWGIFPLYWPLLKPLGALEILAHRVVWSFAVLMSVLAITRRLRWWSTLDRNAVTRLSLAAAFISANWVLYIWAVNAGHVVETSLGYFINPLISVVFGVTLLGERLRRIQWLFLGIALTGVIVLSIDHGRPPWIALGLAPTFALYGLVKKRAGVGALESLTFETSLLLPLALAYLAFLQLRGDGGLGHVNAPTHALLVTSGLMTALPLLCFGAAANRIPLSTLGMLQYLAPSLQFLCGVVFFHEHLSPMRWAGFALIWASLACFALETLRALQHVHQPGHQH